VTDLVLVAIGIAVVFTAAVSLPAWRLAQRSITTALAYE
jgi:ABC-type antimicrobial peptide transport system permease subunit